MPRFSRNNIKTQYFHVITQGINKSYIFEKGEDIKYYIRMMYLLEKEQKIKILAYCIMNNHAHILINTEEPKELSKYMQRLNTRYGQYYNKKYNRVGYVFRDRYKSEAIYNKQHLYNCIKYIYDNPVKAGMCNNPADYQYSNYKKIEFDIKEKYVIMDIDEKENECKDIIENFLIENNMEMIALKKDREKLRELIRILKDEANISLREISKQMQIGREMARRIYNE